MKILESLSTDLQLSVSYLKQLSQNTSLEYRRIEVPKRSGGTRVLLIPSPRLKLIQRQLVDAYLQGLPVHPAATAYSSGSSAKKHADRHARQRFLLCMDFKNFFYSISSTDLADYLTQRCPVDVRLDPEDAGTLTDLVTWKGRLVIGAPSSPVLSNAICMELDRALSDAANQLGCRYSRYADDLAFSTQKPDILREMERRVYGIVAALDCPSSLAINRKKTRHRSRRSRIRRRELTGLVLTQDGQLSVGRRYRRTVRSMVHSYESLPSESQRALAGRIAYIEHIEPGFKDRLEAKFGAPRLAEVLSASNKLSNS